MSIVVTTPTGNIGHVVVEELLKAGEKVTVVVRDPARLSAEVRDRVALVVGDQYEPGLLASAAEGASALFYVTPPNFTAADWRAVYAKRGRRFRRRQNEPDRARRPYFQRRRRTNHRAGTNFLCSSGGERPI